MSTPPHSHRRVRREVAFTGIARLGEIGGILAVQLLLARMLPTAEYGRQVTLSSVQVFIAVVGSLGLGQAALTFNLPDGARPMSARSARVLMIQAAVLTASLSALVFALIARDLPLVALCVSTASIATVQVSSGFLRSSGRIAIAAMSQGPNGGVVMSGSLLLAYGIYGAATAEPSLEGVLVVQGLVAPLVAIAVLLRTRVRSPDARRRRSYELRPLIVWSLAFVPSMAMAYLPAEIWAAALLFDDESVAIFGAARRVALTAVVGLQVVRLGSSRRLAELLNTDLGGARRLVARMTIASALLSLPFLVPLFLAPEAILTTVFGADFSEGASVLVLLSVGLAVNVVTGPCGAVLSMSGHEPVVAVLNGAGVVVFVVLAGALTPAFDLEGLALASAIATTARFLAMTVLAHHYCGIWTPLSIRKVRVALATPGIHSR